MRSLADSSPSTQLGVQVLQAKLDEQSGGSRRPCKSLGSVRFEGGGDAVERTTTRRARSISP